MANGPTIAAIVPLFNGEEFIEEAIDSILAQTLLPTEILVIDDGSADDGPRLIDELSKSHSIRLISQQNGGQAAARNKGVVESDCDLIAFLDQDDIWYPTHLETLVAPFLRQEGGRLGWSYSNLDHSARDGSIVTHGLLASVKSPHPKLSLEDFLGSDLFVLPSASVVSRTAILNVGGFDERLRGYEDDDLFLRLYLYGYSNCYVDQPLSAWRSHGSSSSVSPTMRISRLEYYRKLHEMFPAEGYPNAVRDLIAPRFARLFLDDYIVEIRNRGSRRVVRGTLGQLKFVCRDLRWQYRLVSILALPAMGFPSIARLVDRLRVASHIRRAFRGPDAL